jgi:predicted component of type VI protein secretion system
MKSSTIYAREKKPALDLAQKKSHLDSVVSDDASIWTESTTEVVQPTRLYQCLLLLAGFMTTFQTIGTNQTYGVFQASPPAEPFAATSS